MRAELFVHRERFALRVRWHPGVAEECKAVPGANWSRTIGAWTYPKTLETLRSMRGVFGDRLDPDQEVLAWARRAKRRELRLQSLGRQRDASLLRVPTVAPGLAEAMASRTYQRAGARFGAVAGSFLLADEPGLGKTAQALATIIESGNWEGQHLIVAPKVSLDSVWRRQINMWTPQAEVVVMPEGKAKRQKAWEEFQELDTPKFLVLNVAMLRTKYGKHCKKCDQWEGTGEVSVKHWKEDHKYIRKVQTQDWPEIVNEKWNYVIVDESHEIFSAYKPSNITNQTQGLLDVKSDFRMALTGTPLRGSETNLWGTLDWLGHKTGGYWAWALEYFEVADGIFGKHVYGIDPSKADAFYKTLDRLVLRRTRVEVRPDLPLGKREYVTLEMTPRQRKQYDEFRLAGETALQTGVVAGQGLLSEMTRLKQMSYGVWTDNNRNGVLTPTGESPKSEWIFQFLRERGVTGNPKTDWLPEKGSAYKFVISSQWTQVIDDLERQLNKAGIETLKITGDITGPRRTKAQEKFQSDDTSVRVILLQTKTGGVALDLDAWCDEMVVVDETYVADDQVQLEGRINNRSGRISPRTWWYLVCEDTVEQAIAEGNYNQHDLQHKLLDGRRGVELALHLIRGGE